jgi:hypothetical protein
MMMGVQDPSPILVLAAFQESVEIFRIVEFLKRSIELCLPNRLFEALPLDEENMMAS